MKKNFFKKLSFVMALAMIISVIAPAAGAFAAATPALSATKKYLHLSGQPGPGEYDFNIKNKVAGSKYAWSSSNEDVAVVDEANGFTTATGVGSAKISVVITYKDGKTKTLTATVVVRDNIETVKVSNPPDKALAVDQEYDFNRSFVTLAGSTKKTSAITRWTVDPADKATIVADSGLFKASVAGEYKVTAYSFQSAEKYESWLATKDASWVLDSDEVTVTVAPSMVSAKQVSGTKAAVTFDSDMSKVVTKDNLKVYRVIGGVSQPVDVLLKGLTFDATGKVATVELYIDFVGGDDYKFVYGTMEKSFTAAKADAGNVKSVVIDTKEIDYTKGAQEIKVKLYDANGVDITTSTLTDTRMTYELVNGSGYISGNKLTLYTKGSVATIKATFHTWTYDSNYNENVVVGTGEIVAVDATTFTISGTVQWTLSKDAPDWSKPVNTILAAGDTDYEVYARFRSTDTSAEKYFYSYGPTDNDGKITFSSSNYDVLIVNGSSVYPNKAGSAVIICYYDGKAVATFPVEVREARTAAVFTLDQNKVTLSNDSDVQDTATVKLTIKDQLGADLDPIDINKISIEPLQGNPTTGNGPVDWADPLKKTELKITAANAGAKGVYNYKIKAYDRVQMLVVDIQEPSSQDIAWYDLKLSSTAVDTAINNDNAVKTVTPTLYGYAPNGVANYKVTWNDGTYNYKVTKDGSEVPTLGSDSLTDGVIEVVRENGIASYGVNVASGAAVTVVSGTAVQALSNGVYVVAAYKDNVVKFTKAFSVTNSQPTASFVREKTDTDKTFLLDAVRDCFKVTLGGSEIADANLYSVEYAFNGRTATDTDNNVTTQTGQYIIKSVKFAKTYTKDNKTYVVEYKVTVDGWLNVR